MKDIPATPSAMNLATLYRTILTRFQPQEHHTTRTDLIQGINIPIPKGTDHIPPTMFTDMGDISTDHNPIAIPTTTGAAVSEGTHHVPHPATTAACTTLWPMNSSIAICAVSHSTGILTLHPTLSTFIPQISLIPLFHGPEPVLLQQLPPHCTGNIVKKNQAMP